MADLQSGWKQDTKSFERFNLMERLPKEIITSLNPYVKIYKVLYENDSSTEQILAQLPFNNMRSGKHKILANRAEQGVMPGQLAVGLKEFTFDYLGNHPGEVDTFVDCKLKLYFSSVEALFKQYKIEHKSNKYNYYFLVGDV